MTYYTSILSYILCIVHFHFPTGKTEKDIHTYMYMYIIYIYIYYIYYACELARYNIDIAALSETRLPDEGSLVESGTG